MKNKVLVRTLSESSLKLDSFDKFFFFLGGPHDGQKRRKKKLFVRIISGVQNVSDFVRL